MLSCLQVRLLKINSWRESAEGDNRSMSNMALKKYVPYLGLKNIANGIQRNFKSNRTRPQRENYEVRDEKSENRRRPKKQLFNGFWRNLEGNYRAHRT